VIVTYIVLMIGWLACMLISGRFWLLGRKEMRLGHSHQYPASAFRHWQKAGNLYGISTRWSFVALACLAGALMIAFGRIVF
jgi:hypothetical protein